jgi:hypothetical protein
MKDAYIESPLETSEENAGATFVTTPCNTILTGADQALTLVAANRIKPIFSKFIMAASFYSCCIQYGRIAGYRYRRSFI